MNYSGNMSQGAVSHFYLFIYFLENAMDCDQVENMTVGFVPVSHESHVSGDGAYASDA